MLLWKQLEHVLKFMALVAVWCQGSAHYSDLIAVCGTPSQLSQFTHKNAKIVLRFESFDGYK